MKTNEFITACRLQLAIHLQHILNLDVEHQALKNQAYCLIFSQGLTHASKDTGLFEDRYLRAGMMQPATYKKSLIAAVLNQLTQEHLLIPLHDIITAQQILKILPEAQKRVFDFKIVNSKIAGQDIPCLQANYKGNVEDEADQLLSLIRLLGVRGAIANKDTLLYILSNNVVQNDQTSQFYVHNKPYSESNIRELVIFIQNLLQSPIVNKNPNLLQIDVHEFYLNFLYRMFTNLFYEYDQLKHPTTLQQQIMLANSLQRLIFKLQFALNNTVDFAEFILGLEFAFDEIAFMLCIIKPYSVKELLQLLPETFIAATQFEDEAKFLHPAITGSCMNAVNFNIKAALKYFETNNHKPVHLFLPVTYYEIPISLQVEPDYDQNSFVIVHNGVCIATATYVEQAVDIMILATNENVNPKHPGHESTDLHLKIDHQLNLRQKSNSSKQMIIIVDATMNSIHDSQLELLLQTYKENVEKGQLAIIIVSSLNKFRNGCGMDRAPGGASVAYYNAEIFTGLECPKGLIGFQESDITPQVMAHTMKYGIDYMKEYSRIVHKLSRHIHDNLIPNELYDSSNPISIDRPYTNDIYARPWLFLTIRFSNVEIQEMIKPLLFEFLENIGIKFRGGFAYNQTAYALPTFGDIQIPRISIGPEANPIQFYLLAEYIQHMNSKILELENHPNVEILLKRDSEELGDKANKAVNQITPKNYDTMRPKNNRIQSAGF